LGSPVLSLLASVFGVFFIGNIVCHGLPVEQAWMNVGKAELYLGQFQLTLRTTEFSFQGLDRPC
jgi:hypothetical protein